MAKNEIPIDRVREYVQQLTPQARSRLLVELERLHLFGDDIAGSDVLLAELRAEFRKGGKAHDRVSNPSRHFFQPLEPMLVNCAPERANAGQISRTSLSAIWEWIGQILLPTMAREYDTRMKPLILANSLREAEQVASAFQSKVVKCLEGALGSIDGADRTRDELAMCTSSRGAFIDLTKMLSVLQAREGLAEFRAALPPKVGAFEGELLATLRNLLDEFSVRHAAAMPFALTMLMKRLETPWQLIRLATKIANSWDAADVAATRYAISVSMVLDLLDDKRLALAQALKTDRIPIAKDILIEIYDIEHALRIRIDRLETSDWGRRLDALMQAVAVHLESEVHNIPKNLHHVLESRALHKHDSLTARLTYLAWKGRDALTGGAAYCRGLVGLGHKSRG